MGKFPSTFFVTGTDTDVGKTFVCAVLTLGLKAQYWKPIQAGFEPCTDTQWIKKVTGLEDKHFLPEIYRLKNPFSPHLAARMDGINIDMQNMQMPTDSFANHLIVEGAGGLMVPINESLFVCDLIKHLNLPVLLVARSGLGTINHSLLTIEKLKENKIPILGVVMNGKINSNNRQAIEKYGQVKVLAEIEPIEIINADNLQQIFAEQFASFL